MISGLRLHVAAAMLALAPLGALPAVAAPVDPVTFAKSLYSLPDLWSSIIVTPEGRKQYLTGGLAATVGGIDRKGQFRDTLDFDPLADAQTHQLTDVSFAVVGTDEMGTQVKVDFKNFGKANALTLTLAPSGEGWVVADIAFQDGRTLVDLLNYACTG